MLQEKESEDDKPKRHPENKESSNQDSESNDSYNWEDMENNPTPDVIDVAYYTVWV